MALLKDCLARAVRNDIIAKNPADNVEIVRHKKKSSKALTQAEEARFVAECYQHNNGVQFLLCLYQGLRIGETKPLTLVDFNFDNRTLTIDKIINDIRQLSTPKTTAGNRTIPLFQSTINAINALGLKVIRDNKQIYKHFHTICQRAGIEGYTVHSLRHTFATRCSERGINVKTTQHWMGHSTVDMTLAVYTHLNKDFEITERDKFDTYIDTH